MALNLVKYYSVKKLNKIKYNNLFFALISILYTLKKKSIVLLFIKYYYPFILYKIQEYDAKLYLF